MKIPLFVQHRHIHLKATDFQFLFGLSKMEKLFDIENEPIFVSKHRLHVKGKKGVLYDIPVLGPFREHTQIELFENDRILLGTKIPLRHSSDLEKSGSCILVSNKKKLPVSSSVISHARHLHLHPSIAKKNHLKHGSVVSLKHEKISEITFNHVVVYLDETYEKSFHITQVEAEMYWLKSGDQFSLC